MNNEQMIESLCEQAQAARTCTLDDARQLVGLLDLTNLNEDASIDDIHQLCEQAHSPIGHVAAICLYPQWLTLAKSWLAGSGIKLATVANFPGGNQSVDIILNNIEEALLDGAHEIDIVFPYQAYLAGEVNMANDFIHQCREKCDNDIILKVILESGEFNDLTTLSKASTSCIEAGVNFLKTSTGKTTKGATLEASAVMMLAIKASQRDVGFKASGGIRNTNQALSYFKLAQIIFSNEWPTSQHFRLGASSLLNELCKLST